MSDSENTPAFRAPHARKRRNNEVDTSNVLPANTKKMRRSSAKQKAVDQDTAESHIKKMAKQIKQMRKALKASNSPDKPEEDYIEGFESEEEDYEEISSFPKSARHIDTTISPLRGLVPAGRRRSQAYPTPMRDTDSGSNDLFGSNNDDDLNNQAVFGSPTTGTTSPTPPRSAERNQHEVPSLVFAEIDVPQVAAWEARGRNARARDYSDEVYKLIVKACTRYEIFIVTEQAFPDATQQTQRAHAFFKEACEDIGANYEVTDRITTIIKARGSRIRGSIKHTAYILMSQAYGFLRLPCGEKGKARNIKQAERLLKDDHFHCMYPDDGEFCFEHPLIYSIFRHVFFGGKKSSVGVAYADHFNPLPLQTIALIVTAVGFCIRRYKVDGIVGDQPFSETISKPFYDGYLVELEEWSAIEPTVTESIRRKQFKTALRGAGASVQKVTGMSEEAKLRARTNLVGREVDTASEGDDDHGAQSEEI